MSYVLIDMDGTLSDGSDRLHYILKKPKNWSAFFKEGINDPMYDDVYRLVMDHHKNGIKIVIFTARPEKNREITETWLKKNNVPFDRIMMRKNGDYRPDFEVKEEMLFEAMIIYQNFPIVAVDDKWEVIQMFRKNNIPVINILKERGLY